MGGGDPLKIFKFIPRKIPILHLKTGRKGLMGQRFGRGDVKQISTGVLVILIIRRDHQRS